MAENKPMADPLRSCKRPWHLALALSSMLALSACDQLGVETPGMVAAKKEAEGRAIGSACRHAMRSIEDCHEANPRSSKAAIFNGWREMDEYMRENDIPGMPSGSARVAPSAAVVPPEEVVLPGTGTTASAPVAAALATTPAGRNVVVSGPNTSGNTAQVPPAPNAPPTAGTTTASSGSVQLPVIPARPNITPSR
jgi:hypothetical protein